MKRNIYIAAPIFEGLSVVCRCYIIISNACLKCCVSAGYLDYINKCVKVAILTFLKKKQKKTAPIAFFNLHNLFISPTSLFNRQLSFPSAHLIGPSHPGSHITFSARSHAGFLNEFGP